MDSNQQPLIYESTVLELNKIISVSNERILVVEEYFIIVIAYWCKYTVYSGVLSGGFIPDQSEGP